MSERGSPVKSDERKEAAGWASDPASASTSISKCAKLLSLASSYSAS